MNRICKFLLSSLLAVCAASAWAADMTYGITFSSEQHYINVLLNVSGLKGRHTSLKMPVWAPGDYVIADYPKNLCDFKVTDAQGRPLPWRKEGKSTWVVAHGRCREMRVSYRVFADKDGLADASVSAQRAFMPTNGVCMYVDGEKDHPVKLTVTPDPRWQQLTTTLKRLSGKTNTFVADDVDELYDSPFLLGNHRVEHRRWDGVDYTFAIETPEGIDQTDFFRDVQKIVGQTHRIFADVPMNQYCFFLLGEGQGGLEHANSQVCFTDGTFRFESRGAYLRMLYLIAHEYFHLYNVKRIRPAGLGPFDYDREVFTPLLWLSEGLTMYYETELLRRAGIIGMEDELGKLSFFLHRIESKEGHRHMSLRQSSYDIWLNFMTDNANEDDVCINYYFKGPVVALLMDIAICSRTEGRHTLDDLMRLLYTRYFRGKQRGFSEEELWHAISETAGGDVADLRRYVDTTDEIDYENLLRQVGMKVDRASWQLQLDPHSGQAQKELLHRLWSPGF